MLGIKRTPPKRISRKEANKMSLEHMRKSLRGRSLNVRPKKLLRIGYLRLNMRPGKLLRVPALLQNPLKDPAMNTLDLVNAVNALDLVKLQESKSKCLRSAEACRLLYSPMSDER